MPYDKSIEAKWQKFWDDNKTYDVDVNNLKNKFYVLVMFPYPSGDRLHMGHWYQYGVMDTWARFQKMQGKDVFFPIGFDAFGLPAENFAIKNGIHPDTSTSKNVAYMIKQFKAMGVSYDWKYQVDTSKPDYYRWTQWVFLQLYKNGLAYKKKAPVNWCPSCQTVLANEQVQEGQCERCESQVIQKDLEQWFFKITAYADRLLAGIDGLDWPSKTKAMQKNWIGRSEGAEITFTVAETGEKFRVFTTRADTLYGATYVVLAPEHPLVKKISAEGQKKAVEAYVAETKKATELDRLATTKEKTGVFTGAHALNPVNGEKIPIWIGDYVIYSYGCGAVMAVPAHDERDFEFATKFNLPIRKVILEQGTKANDPLEKPFVEPGTVINSPPYEGMDSREMKNKITSDLKVRGLGKHTLTFRLRDWLISRQRYWGSPIPIVYCPKCGEVPVPEEDLPVMLPKDVDFRLTGESPLKRHPDFSKAKCPACKGSAQREVDTLDTFVCSSWYYLRFPCAQNQKVPFEKGLTKKMLPVDRYVGGPEHACMHLLYARFVNMVMKDLGYIDFEEPFSHLTHQGLVLGPDGQKMSKSKGNSVSPDPYVEEHGADILRLYLMFGFNYVDGGPWEDGGIKAVNRFIERLWTLFETRLELMKDKSQAIKELSQEDKNLLFVLHNSIKMATHDTERFMFNTSIARFMELYNALTDYLNKVPKENQNLGLIANILRTFVVLLAPFAPHFAEEWWHRLGNEGTIFKEPWPIFEEKFLQMEKVSIAVMINGKWRDEILIPADAKDTEILEIAKANPRIIKHLQDKTVVKHIIVPKKLINLIVK